jgi:hypothetical protein
MKRFQVEKTQTGYLAKKRKRPVTQRQYYDQGVPSNVLLPPRTLYAQNILDSHGSSFFDTFSYLNFMKDYFKQNQIIKPSFTDPNSLWGKITKWHRDRKERKAKEEEEEWKEAEKIHEKLEAIRKRLDELENGGNPNPKDLEERKKLIEEELELEGEDNVVNIDTNREGLPLKYVQMMEDGMTKEKALEMYNEAKKKEEKEKAEMSRALAEIKNYNPEWLQRSYPFRRENEAQPEPSVLEETEQEEREAAEKIKKRLKANNKRIDELYNGGNPDPKDFEERKQLIDEQIALGRLQHSLNWGVKTEKAQALKIIKKSHPEWLQGLYPDEVEKETTLAVIPPRRNDENMAAEMLEQVLKEAEDPAKRGEPSMLIETTHMYIPPKSRNKTGILNALSKAFGSPLWNDKGRQELEKALKRGLTPDFITVRDENGHATTFNFDDILEKGMKGKPGVIIESRIKEDKPREEKTRQALEDLLGNKRFSKATRKTVLERDQKKRDKLIRERRDFRLL